MILEKMRWTPPFLPLSLLALAGACQTDQTAAVSTAQDQATVAASAADAAIAARAPASEAVNTLRAVGAPSSVAEIKDVGVQTAALVFENHFLDAGGARLLVLRKNVRFGNTLKLYLVFYLGYYEDHEIYEIGEAADYRILSSDEGRLELEITQAPPIDFPEPDQTPTRRNLIVTWASIFERNLDLAPVDAEAEAVAAGLPWRVTGRVITIQPGEPL